MTYNEVVRIGDAYLYQATLMESIADTFEYMQNTGEDELCDEELSYRIKCLEDDIPYVGFFHETYSCEKPFIQ